MLDPQVALITGAGKGIGRATALLLARQGMRLGLFSRTETDLETLQAEIEGGQDRCLTFVGDVGNESAVCDCVQRVESTWGKVDILVNNAGYGVSAPVHQLKVADWDGMISTNLRGTFLFTRAVVPGMIRRREGVIINVASIAGKDGFAGGTGYAASKHGVMGFTDSLWRELREHNIRVCAICPGSVDTHFFGADVGGVGRDHMMQAQDVARAIAYVAAQPDRLFIKEIEMRVTHPRKG